MSSWRRLTGLVTLVAILIAAPSAAALPEQPDAGVGVANGTVNAIAQQGDTTYLGGNFTYVGRRVGQGIALAKSDASLQTFPEVAGGSVVAAQPDGAGGWYIGGDFTHVGGSALARLAHVLPDGTVDGSFAPNPNNSVSALAFDDANDRLYVGGTFTQIGGQTRTRLARILTATNAVDSWDPKILGGGATVRSLELHTNQAAQPLIWAGGIFDHVGDTTAGNARTNFAEIRTDNSSLSAFYAAVAPNSYVNDIEFDGTNIYLGGSFNQVQGTTRNGLAALGFASGTLQSWNPNLTRGGLAGFATDLAVGTGVIYVAGSFDKVGSDTRNTLAAINSASALATGWNPNPSGNLTHFSPGARNVAVDGSTVYVGGAYASIGGQARNGLAALDATTGAATGWDANLSNETYVVAVAGSTVFAGGPFTAAKGAHREGLAALDASGALTPWSSDIGFNETVNALAAGATGPIYIAGDFTEVGGQPRASIAAVDTAGAVTPWHPDSSGVVNALALSPGGQTLYAGGNFSTLGGAPRENLGALDTSSNTARSWDPDANGNVRSLLLRPDGSRIYVGGEFDNFGGGATMRNSAAEFDPASNTPTAWNPAPDSTVRAFALSQDGSTVFLGGDFTDLGTTPRRYLAAVDAGSGAPRAFNPDPDGVVFALALAEDGKTLFAGGEFGPSGPIGGAPRDSLAELDVATGAATSWNPDPDDTVRALLRTGPDLLAAGDFSRVGARAHSSFARFVGPRPQSLPITQPPPVGPPATPSAAPPDKTAPLLSALSLTNKVFAVSPKPTALSAAKRSVKKGTTFRWTLSEGGATRIQIQQERRGIKVGKRCRVAKPREKVSRKRHCTALQSKGTLRRTSKKGRNSTAFSGRMGKRALKPGSYRAVFTATDAAGNRSTAKRLQFRIVRAR